MTVRHYFDSSIISSWNGIWTNNCFCMVVDNASSNDSMVRHLKSWMVEKVRLPLGGDLFHVHCGVHVLNLIVQDGLTVLGDLILKKFECALQQCKLKNKKKVALDVQTRWNSTYLMLEYALPLKEAFNHLAQIDRNYNGKNFPTSNVFFPDMCKIQLKLREWENSQYDFLKVMVGPMKQKFEKC
ncbi:hypothetical protein M9H77_20676 [Catharanthus roseus]|uniref:Uncharacterized protein n=1 Tax=Catharanthus roseus TaxID=4058 RepID=A0ACC0AN33_CATRO|nr:hypothetical protein M9H77_20676 [Catharanthus roseus]